MVLPSHVAWYQKKPTDRKWGLAVVTSIKVNVFEQWWYKRVLILFTGLFQNVLYLAKCGQKCLNKYPKMQQCRDCPLSFHGNQNQETWKLPKGSNPCINPLDPTDFHPLCGISPWFPEISSKFGEHVQIQMLTQTYLFMETKLFLFH